MTKKVGDIKDIENEAATKGDLSKATQRMDYLFTAVTLALAIGFISVLIAMLSPVIDAWRFRAETYQNLVNRVSEQSAKIDILISDVNQLKAQYENKKVFFQR